MSVASDPPLGSEEARALSQRLINANYDRMSKERNRLSEDVMTLTNENRELKAENAELQDKVNEYRRG